jgi:hypothetical protein
MCSKGSSYAEASELYSRTKTPIGKTKNRNMQANDDPCRSKRNNGIWLELHPEVTEIQAENPAILAKRKGCYPALE